MLDILANVADVIAAIGVIASLLFVALELRAQNRETRLQTWRDLQSALTDFKSVTNEPWIADVVERGHADYEALAGAERRAFDLYMEQGIHVIGNYEKHVGAVPQEFANLQPVILNTMRDHVSTPGARAWWQKTKPRARFLPATAATIDALQAQDASSETSDS